MILEKIDQLLQEVGNLKASNAEEIEQLRLKYLSKKGEITALMADFRNVAADQKKAVGMKINELKQLAMQKINELKEQNEVAEESADDFDLTRSAHATRSTSSRTKSSTYSSVWDSLWQKDRRLTTTCTCSPSSTSQPITPLAICRTRSSSSRTPTT